MPELAHLRTFLAVYRCGSITQAATQLGMSQPAATGHVRALEGEAQEALFVRLPRGVAPTGRAHALAREIAPHLDALGSIASGLLAPRVEGQLVRLGGPGHLLATRLLPTLIPLLGAGIRLRVQRDRPAALLTRLRRRRLDLAVLNSDFDAPDVRRRLLWKEQYALVATSRWVAQIDPGAFATDPAAALRNVPLVDYADDCPLTTPFFADVLDTPLTQRAAVVVNDIRAVAAAVRENAGYSVLPLSEVEGWLADGVVSEFGTRRLTEPVYLARLHVPLGTAAASVAEALSSAAVRWNRAA